MKKKTIEQKGRRINIERTVLNTLVGAGIIATALVAPNAIGALKKIDPHWEHKINPRLRVSQTLYRLQKKGLVQRASVGWSLTSKGRHVLALFEQADLRIKKPFRWDGRWRLVTFDVAERNRLARNRLRTLLKRIGFIKLQQSIWVYPYDCEDVVALITSEQRLAREVQYIIADVIGNDRHLRQHFCLRGSS